MGLFGGLQDLLGSKNTYHVDPLNLNTFDYNEAMKKAQEAALGSINQGNAAGQNQAELNKQLMQQASGQGPSLAQLQLQQGADQNIKNAASLIASQRSLNPAQAARSIALAQQSQGQNLANQAAQLRLQEQLQKQQLLASSLASQRGQDIGQQGANAQLFGLTGQLNQGQNAQALQNYYAAHGINAGIEAQNVAGANALGGQVIGAGAAALGGGMFSGGGGGGASEFSMPSLGSSSTGSNAVKPSFGGLGGNYQFGPSFYSGGKMEDDTNAMVSPGEKIIEPDGDIFSVKGKAKVKGDHPANDTVPVYLEDGTVVVPRTKAKSKEEMFDFLSSIKGKTKQSNPIEELLKKREEISGQIRDLDSKIVQVGIKRNFYDGTGPEGFQSEVSAEPTPAYDPRPGSPYSEWLKQKELEGVAQQQQDMLYFKSAPALAEAERRKNLGIDQVATPDSLKNILEPKTSSEIPSTQPLVNVTDKFATQKPEKHPIENPLPEDTAKNPYAFDLSGGYNMAKKAGNEYTAGIDSTMAKYNEIADEAAKKAEQRNIELDQLANQKINSNNYWGNMSTPDKIRSGIALLLGGIGAGLAGGKNLALETINDAINKDIEDQKANKNSMYNALIQKGHNDEYATAATLKSINNQIEGLTKKYSVGLTNANQKQALDQFNAQLKMQQMNFDNANKTQATKTAIIDKALSGKELSPQEMVGLPEKIKQKYIGGQGGGYAPYGSEKMFTDASAALAQRNGIDESIKEIKALVQEGSRAGISTEEKAKANARAAALVGQLRLLIAGPGTLSDSDKEQIYKVIPENPLALFSLTGNTMAKLDTAMDLVNSNTQKSLALVGLNRNFSRSQQQNSFLNNSGAKEVAR